MAKRITCPNRGCGKKLAADLRIDASAQGFSRVSLGWKCKACGTVTRHVGAIVERATEALLQHAPH